MQCRALFVSIWINKSGFDELWHECNGKSTNEIIIPSIFGIIELFPMSSHFQKISENYVRATKFSLCLCAMGHPLDFIHESHLTYRVLIEVPLDLLEVPLWFPLEIPLKAPLKSPLSPPLKSSFNSLWCPLGGTLTSTMILVVPCLDVLISILVTIDMIWIAAKEQMLECALSVQYIRAQFLKFNACNNLQLYDRCL